MRVLLLLITLAALSVASAKQYNVLHLICDDLRPEIAAGYRQPFVITPNIDRLVNSSLVFERAACQVAVCCPSRSSFMTGRRPDHTQVFSNSETCKRSFRAAGPDWTTLPGHFKAHGYTVLGGGKTFHPGSPPDFDPQSWSKDHQFPYFPFSYGTCAPQKPKVHDSDVSGIDTYCVQDEPDEHFYDATLANHTIALLKHVKALGNPFYVAAGFAKPHVPWQVPRRIWDQYENVDIPLPKHMTIPEHMPDIAYHNQGIFTPDGSVFVPRTNTSQCVGGICPINATITKLIRRAYYSAITWVDSQIGRVLDALDELELTNSTIVLLHGDHGYHLMEHQMVHKQTAFELTSRVPLMIRAPFKPNSQGKTTTAFAELVDLYPTLAELAGTPTPSDKLDGTSLASVFDDPTSGGPSDTVHWQYARCIDKDAPNQWDHNECGFSEHATSYMGYTMRNAEWRYTAWMHFNVTTGKGRWDADPHARELYSHVGDDGFNFDISELENVAGDPSNHNLVLQLHEQLKQFFNGEENH